MDKKIIERAKMVVCMEYIARQINNENVFDGWLMGGVADGDIKYGDLDPGNVPECYLSDDSFKDLMSCFLRRMTSAYKSGGLYCGRVVSDYKTMED